MDLLLSSSTHFFLFLPFSFELGISLNPEASQKQLQRRTVDINIDTVLMVSLKQKKIMWKNLIAFFVVVVCY